MTTQEPTQQGQQALADALRTSFKLLRVALLVLLGCYLLSGIFIVGQSERAVVLTFGNAGPGSLKEPGLHITYPRPFTEIVRVPTDTTRTVDIESFWNPPPPSESTGSWRYRPQPFAYCVSGDSSLMHSNWKLGYQVSDPTRVTLDIADLETLLRFETERAVVHHAARRSIEQLLSTEVDAFRSTVEQALQRRVEDLALGVRVQRLDLVAGDPPWPVVDAFDAAAQAEQERSEQLSQARAYASRQALESAGQAAGVLAVATAFSKRSLSDIQADASYFETLVDKPAAELDLVTRSMLQDGLRRTLQNVEEKYVIHRGPDGSQEFRFQIGPERDKTLTP